MKKQEFIDMVNSGLMPAYAENCNRIWKYLFKNKQDALYITDTHFFVVLTLCASTRLVKEKFQDIVDVLTVYDNHSSNKALPYVMSMLFTSIPNKKMDNEWFNLLNPYMPSIYYNKSFGGIVTKCNDYLNRDEFYDIVYKYNQRTDLKDHEEINWLDWDIAKEYFTEEQYNSLLDIYKTKFNVTPVKQTSNIKIDCQVGLAGIF